MNKIYSVITFLSCICFILGSDTQKLFNRYQIIEVGGVKDFDDDELYSRLSFEPEDEFEILHRRKIEGTAQVLVKPEIFSKFEDEVKRNELSYKVIIEDIEELLRAQKILRANTEPLTGESTFDRYMNLAEIQAFLLSMQQKYPDKLKLKNIGKSFHGENMTLVIISDDINNSDGTEKPVIFIEAGVHAREWISFAAAVYIIDRLTNSSSLTHDVEWRIVPVSNPDGYKYSWTNNRLWRKNLRTHSREKHCIGVDLNRNFGAFWGGSGSSRKRCSQIYAGESVFSEPETQAIKDAFAEVKHRIKAYISVHSYGQMILIPPSHSNMFLTQGCAKWLDSVAGSMSKAIAKVTNAKYIYGSPVKLLYPATGTSMDWAFSASDSLISFTFELRDTGKAGFLLPEQEIFDGVSEFWGAMIILHGFVGRSNSSTPQDGACLQSRSQTEYRESSPQFLYNSEIREIENTLETTTESQSSDSDYGVLTSNPDHEAMPSNPDDAVESSDS